MKQKRCRYCGRYFIPDKRVGDRQKSCSRAECKRKRKQESQASWSRKNPGYFKGRYENTKAWLARNKGYLQRRRHKRKDIQDECPLLSSMKSIRFLIPVNLLKKDIQDKCLVLTSIDSITYVARPGW